MNSKIIKYLSSYSYRFMINDYMGLYNKLDDRTYLVKKCKAKFGKSFNIDSPVTYNEKLQWLKLNNRNPKYTMMVDKYLVRNYIKDMIGDKYLIPLLGVWDNAKDIDFDDLPNKFVLKCNHNSGGGMVICKDKSALDIERTRRELNENLGINYYKKNREWPYKNVKPRIIAEQYMEDSKTKELRDYKFFCFDGEVKFMFVATDRQKDGEEVKFDFFDENYNHLPVKQGHENASTIPNKPLQFDLMKELAKKLSNGIPHVRVDFYEVDGEVFFGEMTFYHFSGFVPFVPEEWDKIFGDLISLPI